MPDLLFKSYGLLQTFMDLLLVLAATGAQALAQYLGVNADQYRNQIGIALCRLVQIGA